MKTNESEEVWVDEEYEFLREGREWIAVPEKRLLFAILERAVRDCLGAQVEEAELATEWLFSDGEDSGTPFSFGWICENAGVSPYEFRDRIVRSAGQRQLRSIQRSISQGMPEPEAQHLEAA